MKRHLTGLRQLRSRVDLYFSSPLFLLVMLLAFMLI